MSKRRDQQWRPRDNGGDGQRGGGGGGGAKEGKQRKKSEITLRNKEGESGVVSQLLYSEKHLRATSTRVDSREHIHALPALSPMRHLCV